MHTFILWLEIIQETNISVEDQFIYPSLTQICPEEETFFVNAQAENRQKHHIVRRLE